ncbi:MAG: mannose-1-phosphate guanylyltransferase [Parcubacteria group bacterium]|nr:mannose-1-phosphate guanylyltransferase [Parcubacteria group bacterium]
MMAVILAGGQGSRLWPLSRRRKPKQFHALLSDKPLLVEAYERLLPFIAPQDVYVSAASQFSSFVSEMLPAIPIDRYFFDPVRLDSGLSMACAAQRLCLLGRGDEPVVFIPTDQAIDDPERFRQALAVGERLVKETGKLLDISVAPKYPLTTLGYTRVGELYDRIDGVDVYKFLEHKEKPDRATAQTYLDSGDYLWHANYYMWTPRKMLEAFAQHASHIHQTISSWSGRDDDRSIDSLTPISIEKAVTEYLSPDDVLIIKGDFGWTDVGIFRMLAEQLASQADNQGNVICGKGLALDSANCFIHGHPAKLIAAFGVSDLVIVDTPDALLICPKDRSSEIKDLVAALEEAEHKDLL